MAKKDESEQQDGQMSSQRPKTDTGTQATGSESQPETQVAGHGQFGENEQMQTSGDQHGGTTQDA